MRGALESARVLVVRIRPRNRLAMRYAVMLVLLAIGACRESAAPAPTYRLGPGCWIFFEDPSVGPALPPRIRPTHFDSCPAIIYDSTLVTR